LKLTLALLVLACGFCAAQPNKKVEDSPLSSSDSLSIFRLIDSLMNLENEPLPSQFALRVGYNSNVNAAGGPFKFDEFGVTTRAAYYHKSGAFADVSGYLSNQYNPAYYLTITSVGYMNSSLKNWSFLVEYSRNIYHLEKESVPISIIYTYNDNYSSQSFRNTFNAGVFYQWKNLNLKVDYSLLTGDRTGHRSNPTLSYTFRKNKWLGLDRITFMPTASVLIGVEQVIFYEQLYKTRLEAIMRLRRGLPLFSEELKDEFGIMNYAIRLPIYLTKKNWVFSATYTYNFPKRLPGETATIENGGNLSLAVTRYFDVMSVRKKN
jgi:hypothetical protein